MRPGASKAGRGPKEPIAALTRVPRSCRKVMDGFESIVYQAMGELGLVEPLQRLLPGPAPAPGQQGGRGLLHFPQGDLGGPGWSCHRPPPPIPPPPPPALGHPKQQCGGCPPTPSSPSF